MGYRAVSDHTASDTVPWDTVPWDTVPWDTIPQVALANAYHHRSDAASTVATAIGVHQACGSRKRFLGTVSHPTWYLTAHGMRFLAQYGILRRTVTHLGCVPPMPAERAPDSSGRSRQTRGSPSVQRTV